MSEDSIYASGSVDSHCLLNSYQFIVRSEQDGTKFNTSFSIQAFNRTESKDSRSTLLPFEFIPVQALSRKGAS